MSNKAVLLSHMHELVEEVNNFINSTPYRLPCNPQSVRMLESHVINVLNDKVVNGKMSQKFFNYAKNKLREIGFFEIFNSDPRYAERRQTLINTIVNQYIKNN